MDDYEDQRVRSLRKVDGWTLLCVKSLVQGLQDGGRKRHMTVRELFDLMVEDDPTVDRRRGPVCILLPNGDKVECTAMWDADGSLLIVYPEDCE